MIMVPVESNKEFCRKRNVKQLSESLALYQLQLYNVMDRNWMFIKCTSTYPYLYEKMCHLTRQDISDIEFLLTLTTLDYQEVQYLRRQHVHIPIESLVKNYLSC